jgi:hypothetical protein
LIIECIREIIVFVEIDYIDQPKSVPECVKSVIEIGWSFQPAGNGRMEVIPNTLPRHFIQSASGIADYIPRITQQVVCPEICNQGNFEKCIPHRGEVVSEGFCGFRKKIILNGGLCGSSICPLSGKAIDARVVSLIKVDKNSIFFSVMDSLRDVPGKSFVKRRRF